MLIVSDRISIDFDQFASIWGHFNCWDRTGKRMSVQDATKKGAVPPAEPDPPSNNGELLVVVVDVSPGQPYLCEDPSQLTFVTRTVVAFANAHLLLSSRNQVAVFAAHSNTVRMVFPGRESDTEQGRGHNRREDGQYEEFANVEAIVTKEIQALMLTEKTPKSQYSLLAGALAHSLAYINRLSVAPSDGPILHTKQSGRMLVLTGGPDCPAQYITFMNCFFTAQKMSVVIDCCVIGMTDSGLMQQGCDISGGIYLRPPRPKGLLQYLLWVFLPSAQLQRDRLVMPPPLRVDYRAACFCHRQLIDIGFVCSVCLSIFCKFCPICTTCLTVFNVKGTLPILKPKKKKHIKH